MKPFSSMSELEWIALGVVIIVAVGWLIYKSRKPKK